MALVVATSALVFFLSKMFIVLVVKDDSMQPDACSGDLIVVRVLDPGEIGNAEPLLGRRIVFANKEKRLAVKRLYATSRNTVSYSRTAVYGPDVRSDNLPVCTIKNVDALFRERTLGEGEVFLVGDNLIASTDSRSFGPAPVSSVVGEVRWVVPMRANECTCKSI